MKRAAIVYNPVAGSRNAAQQATRAKEILEEEGWAAQLLATSGPGGAESLARTVRDEIDLLVVAGGDGSIREAITGLGPERQRVVVAVLPCGNANVVARELGIPLAAVPALEVLRDGHPQPIDVGRVDSDLFLAMVGIGYDARTVRHLSRLRATRFGGWWYRVWADSAYFLAGVAAVFVRRRDQLRVSADGQAIDRDYCAALIANFRCYGKGWAMVPDASYASGKLHYLARKRFGPIFVAWQLIAAMLRRRTPPFVADYGQGSHINVRSDRPFAVQVDGDDRGSFTEVEIVVEPAAASILTPSL